MQLRALLSISLLILLSGCTNRWETDHFSLSLPKSYKVEIDGAQRLVAHVGEPYSAPFLVIEFGTDVSLEQMLESFTGSIGPDAGEMRAEPCKPNCQAFYIEHSDESEQGLVHTFHYIVQTASLTFIVSFMSDESLESGRDFVREVGEQILRQHS